jgi:hypothetical protein
LPWLNASRIPIQASTAPDLPQKIAQLCGVAKPIFNPSSTPRGTSRGSDLLGPVRHPLGERKMKRRIQYGTDRGIASKEAAKKIRILIADLNRTVQILEEDQTATLDARRYNLMDTIASLEKRLGSIEHLRACQYERARHEPAKAALAYPPVPMATGSNSGPTSAPRFPQARHTNRGSRSDNLT